MAKKRFGRRVRSFGRKAKRMYSRANKGTGGLLTTGLMGFGYGAVREPVAQLIDPLSSQVPYGVGDELILGTAGVLVHNYVNKDAGKAILTVESARLGDIARQMVFKSGVSMTNTVYY